MHGAREADSWSSECRVIYAIRTPSDHGAVNNDEEWLAEDAAVVEAEPPEELMVAEGRSAQEDVGGAKKGDTQK